MNKEHIDAIEKKIEEIHRQIEKNVEENQRRVLKAFQNYKVSDGHFHSSTGYGYDDFGRDTLELVYAEVFGVEDAIVRPQIVSGTHAITTALFGILRPGDELLYITGKPYDTLDEIVESKSDKGSLKDFGIEFKALPLTENDQSIDYDLLGRTMSSKTKMIGIQRSKGYANRPSFSVTQIKEMIDFVKEIHPEVIVFVDNCYGEFVETSEPTHVGADIMAGSLIKNPGGGIAKTGGYIVGKKQLIEQCAYRLTSPGLGKEVGASLQMLQDFYFGFFMAPHIVGEALKGAVFTSAYLESIGFKTSPSWNSHRTDLIQTVTFTNKEEMIGFCQAIQSASPINSHVTPYPSPMPGYSNEVIMAAGTFVQGGSLELSADGPIRPPYTAYVQGGLTYSHVKIAVTEAVNNIREKNTQ
ncbi:methionine gamma-lyase family protein [Bacillaceae bacterium S4-13-58]